MAEQERDVEHQRPQQPHPKMKLEWRNGRFYFPTPSPPPQTYWENKASLLTVLHPQQNKQLQKFVKWRLTNVPETDRTDDLLDLQVALWVRSLPIAPTSKRTYFLTTLGEIGGLQNFRLEETPRLKKLKKLFEKECAPYAPTRAPILNIEEFSVIFPQSLVIIAVIGTLTAARVGN
jgi:hypothetical protein